MTATIVSVYYALTLPVSFDEACTYILFTREGLAETVTNYPAPNNHVFFSILTGISNNLPFGNLLFKIRLTSIVINILTLLALYKFAVTFFSRNFGLLLVGLYSGLFLTVYYSYMARGYGLVTLLFIGCLYYTFKIIDGDENRKNFLFFGLFSVIGLYTIPTFIYPIISLSVYIVFVKRHLFWTQFKVGFGIFLTSILLYAPIIYNCGLNSIISNLYVKPMGFIPTLKSIPVYPLLAIQEITGIHWLIVIAICSLSLYFIWKSKERRAIFFVVVMILTPLILIVIQRVNPYARVFNYCSIVLLLLVLMPYKTTIDKLKLSYMFPLLLVIQCVSLFNFETKILAYEDKDWGLNITSDKIIKKIQGNHHYYTNGNLIFYNLKFDLISNGFTNYKIAEEKGKNVSADTLPYDYSIIGLDFDKTKSKKPLYKTRYYNVYSGN
ncbi:glycosyltransferase family 39 protein [Flavobacterium sangjuense]|uniref:glycosyltransferase family 39 protein n=1 Tax=Flavobacterium sangjuense TaxID=2518177 RepID=UPI0014480787|nr:glycosyltransferase family 39 protein [Flavobacterium sangjuense]